MTDSLVNILDGNTFVVCDERGDIEAAPSAPTGLFSFDTRYVSKWVLTIDGERLTPLSIDDLQYYETRFFLVPGPVAHYVDAKLSIIRQRSIAAGVTEQLTILNHDDQPTDLRVRVEIGSDFADLFEIKNVTGKKGTYYRRVDDGTLRFGYQRDTFHRQTAISASSPVQVDEEGLTFQVHIGPHESWTTELKVEALALGPTGQDLRAGLYRAAPKTTQTMQSDLDRWLSQAPRLSSDNESLNMTYRRSLVDLAALQYWPISGQDALPAAGLPWFMTLFGRDSVFTSLQALPFLPGLAATTLRTLANLQGTKLDDFRDEDPGRILHEMRYGETAGFQEQPHTPYYGAADSTQLFIILLDEYERWTGDAQMVRDLEHHVRAGLNWMDDYADLVGNGYIWYERRNLETGLENQCWKDSWDSISYHDGRLPPFPRATCEIQGYAYDAKMRAARLARTFWQDPELADRLEREAAEFKERFNRDFWVEDGEFYALGLDPDGNPVDSLSSNIGHLLWSGIVETSRARKVADHLLGPRLFTGWGIRTLAEGEGRYNPIGYHVGTVWPFDNSFIAWGLRRYGFTEEAGLIAEGMIDSAEFFRGRLPEAFAGYPRSLTKYPVQYPTACSPQAWSTGTPLLLLRTMLGLEPHGEHLVVEPSLPVGFGRIELLDIPGRWGRSDAFARGRVEIQARPALRVQHGGLP